MLAVLTSGFEPQALGDKCLGKDGIEGGDGDAGGVKIGVGDDGCDAGGDVGRRDVGKGTGCGDEGGCPIGSWTGLMPST